VETPRVQVPSFDEFAQFEFKNENEMAFINMIKYNVS
jgi:hypothetical protein